MKNPWIEYNLWNIEHMAKARVKWMAMAKERIAMAKEYRKAGDRYYTAVYLRFAAECRRDYIAYGKELEKSRNAIFECYRH